MSFSSRARQGVMSGLDLCVRHTLNFGSVSEAIVKFAYGAMQKRVGGCIDLPTPTGRGHLKYRYIYRAG